MTTDFDRVRGYYGLFDERSRLDTPEGAIEFQQTLGILKEHLAPDSRILDLGGGPGRYALELVRSGYHVVLADISPELLDAARQMFVEERLPGSIESIDEVNAVDLGRYDDNSFDAVLALGPFYHLVGEDERERAATEIYRVLRPSGTAFVAYIPRISGITGLIERAALRPNQVPPDVLRETAETGVFRNASDSGFQEGYYPWPGEIATLLRKAGFEVKDEVSLKSVAYRLEKQMVLLDEHLKAEIVQMMADLSRHPEIIATSGHVLVVAGK